MNSEFEMKKAEMLQTLSLDLAQWLALLFHSTPGT